MSKGKKALTSQNPIPLIASIHFQVDRLGNYANCIAKAYCLHFNKNYNSKFQVQYNHHSAVYSD